MPAVNLAKLPRLSKLCDRVGGGGGKKKLVNYRQCDLLTRWAVASTQDSLHDFEGALRLNQLRSSNIHKRRAIVSFLIANLNVGLLPETGRAEKSQEEKQVVGQARRANDTDSWSAPVETHLSKRS